MMGERAHGEISPIASPATASTRTAGGKIITPRRTQTSNIIAKSISRTAGKLLTAACSRSQGAHGSKSKVVCEALLLDEARRSDTYPTISIGEDDVKSRPRGDRLEGRRRAEFLPAVPRHLRGGGAS